MIETEYKVLLERLQSVKARIAAAAQKAGRDPLEILLVAATKMNDAERVQAAIQLGLTACGETCAGTILEKYDKHAYDGAELQFIGTLQTNKVKYLIGKVSLIHIVGSIKLAECIAKEAKKHEICQNILLEVNIGREQAKSGFLPEGSFRQALEILPKLPNIHLRSHWQSRHFRRSKGKATGILQKCNNYLLTYPQKNTIMYLWTICLWV